MGKYFSLMGEELYSYDRVLSSSEIIRVEEALPKEVYSLLDKYPDLVLAGGFIRAVLSEEPIKDIDLFSCSRDLQKKYFEELHSTIEDTNSDVKTIRTENSFTLKYKGNTVQFIHRWTYPTAKELIDSFDFSISCASMWRSSGKWNSEVGENFRDDLKKKRLRFNFPNRIEEPTGSLLRVLKFTRLGYSIDSKSLAGIVTKAYEGSKNKAINEGRHDNQLDSSWSSEEVTNAIHASIFSMTGES